MNRGIPKETRFEFSDETIVFDKYDPDAEVEAEAEGHTHADGEEHSDDE